MEATTLQVGYIGANGSCIGSSLEFIEADVHVG